MQDTIVINTQTSSRALSELEVDCLPEHLKYGYPRAALVDQGRTQMPAAVQAAAPAEDRGALPAYLAQTLRDFGLMGAYRSLPRTEQLGYVLWVTGACREETRRQRIAQMLDELASSHLPECVSISSDWYGRTA
jgi:hypothetical protein